MAAALCFSLAACGNNSELEKYEKYETLIDYLEAEDYESALAEMVKTSGNADILENDEQDYFEVQTQMDLYRNDFGEIDNPIFAYTCFGIKSIFPEKMASAEEKDALTIYRRGRM